MKTNKELKECCICRNSLKDKNYRVTCVQCIKEYNDNEREKARQAERTRCVRYFWSYLGLDVSEKPVHKFITRDAFFDMLSKLEGESGRAGKGGFGEKPELNVRVTDESPAAANSKCLYCKNKANGSGIYTRLCKLCEAKLRKGAKKR